MTKNEFGRWLRASREARNESLRTAATRIGCSHVYLSEIETGAKSPSPTKVVALAGAYGMVVRTALRIAMEDRIAAVRAEFNSHGEPTP